MPRFSGAHAGHVILAGMTLLSRTGYRLRQFRNALFHSRQRVENEVLVPHLNPTQIMLFRQMQASEQAHAWQVLRHLEAAGQTDADLLAAALLHDVGKIQSPLSIFDRVTIVLGNRFLPRLARRWGQGTARGLRRPFVVAACHADWGAELAARAGASPRTCELIRRHQNAPGSQDMLLSALQAADDES